MTSALDHRQPIIAQGERRKPRALGDITNLVITRTAVKKPTKKASKSLSSVLGARSKVASGIATTKPKDPVIINIDDFDKNNELAEVEYVEDIYMFYKLSETQGYLRDYMDSQPDINARMRAILLDWLIQVHNNYDLMPETLYLTINIVDRYLSVTTVARTELQLVGISALLISSKYEEIWPLAVNDMITISDSAYSREQIRAMEKAILSRLGWYLTVPTPYVFTVRYAKASLPTDNEMENMVFFFTELGLMDYLVTIRNNPSILAASAVYAASDDEESNHEDASDTGDALKQQQQVIPQTTAILNIKQLILKKEEYDIWAMEMEHYLEYIGNEDGIVRILSPVTAEEIQAVEKERKAKNILLMAISKEHMRRFHVMDDAKEIWESIRTRFGGNANLKKM
ncbi:cyclin [Tanacetum coccineum]|uniref:Cyclin n=1 Tax=Tanacetum coccineum TaxID=301880 RepID=A0ABQ5CK04_9ASTR